MKAAERDAHDSSRSNLGAKAVFVAKSAGRRLRWLPHDVALGLQRTPDLTRPPRGISYVGRGDSVEVGRWYLEQFKSLGGINPDDRVLDVGCGVGRMAVPLMEYLDRGSYKGFDTSSAMVKWCRRNITKRDPRFTFTTASIQNRKYNPFGEIPAHQYTFPYEDSSFDFVVATSVFTHLGIRDARRYFSEIARVLSPGGTAFLTFFLLRPGPGTSERNLAFNFDHEFGPLRTTDPKEPEAAVAWPPQLLLLEADSTGLALKRPIVFGSWTEERVGRDIQDIVVLSARQRSHSDRD